ncbi:MAG: ABC transporter ATP-binding protein [Deltaproteobacteria bacterium]|nr:ABC transporter ATP-binding protein [Deltaproteobacteria bacterium]
MQENINHPETILWLRNLSKTYRSREGEVEALSNLCLKIAQGEIIGILGPNGAGKTTAVKLIMGFIKASRGEIFFKEKELQPAQARPLFGYLPESFRPNPNLSVGEYIRMQNNLAGPATTGTRRVESATQITTLLHQVGMAPFAGRRISRLSKGMGQRVGLAQALAGSPELMILDEPTSGLDPIGKSEVIDLLLTLKKEGKTILFCSHILAEVERLCDRIGIIVGGRLRFLGKVDDFLALHQAHDLDQAFKKEVKCAIS